MYSPQHTSEESLFISILSLARVNWLNEKRSSIEDDRVKNDDCGFLTELNPISISTIASSLVFDSSFAPASRLMFSSDVY